MNRLERPEARVEGGKRRRAQNGNVKILKPDALKSRRLGLGSERTVLAVVEPSAIARRVAT
jgi:hypothetical protein